MTIIHIPDLDASPYDIDAALTAAQALLDEARLAWCVDLVATAFKEWPLLGAIRVHGDVAFTQKEAGYKPTRIYIGGPPPYNLDRGDTFDRLTTGARSKAFNAKILRQLHKAEKHFASLAGDPRIEPFVRAGLASSGPGSHWIQRGADPIPERHLCKKLGRPDLWAKMEAKILASHAKAAKAPTAASPIRI